MSKIILIISLVFLAMFPEMFKSIFIKKSTDFLGRKLKIGDFSLSIRGKFEIKNFYIYEKNSNNVFVSFESLSGDINVKELIFAKIIINDIKLIKPTISIIKDSDIYNFTDIVQKIEEDTKQGFLDKIHFSFENINFQNGFFSYIDKTNKKYLNLNEINLYIKQIQTNQDIFSGNLNFAFAGNKGKANGNYEISLNQGFYKANFNINNIFFPLIDQFINFNKNYMFDFIIDGDVNINGNYSKNNSCLLKGNAKIRNCKIIENEYLREILLFDNCLINNFNYDLINKKYVIDKITLKFPYLKVVKKDEKNNTEEFINNIILKDENIEEKNSDNTKAFWQIKEINVEDGKIDLIDYNFAEPFKYEINNIDLTIKNFSGIKDENFKINIKCVLNNGGELFANINTIYDYLKYIKINMNINDLYLPDFSYYTSKYLSYPIIEGRVDWTSNIKIKEKKLESENLLKIKGIKVGEKNKSSEGDVPLKFVVSVLKDKKNNILFDLPINGDLNDTNFKISEIIFSHIKKRVTQTAASPLKFIGKLIGAESDEITEIPLEYGKIIYKEEQIKRIKNIIKLLKEKEEIKIEFTQYTDLNAERINLALNLCKEKYYKNRNNLTDTYVLSDYEQMIIYSISDNDTNFINYIKNYKLNTSETIPFSLLEKCVKIIGENRLNEEIKNIIELRNEILRKQLLSDEKIKEERFIIKNTDFQKLDQTEKRCRYTINVIGALKNAENPYPENY